MAKKIPNSIIELLRSIDGKTLVRSSAYGFHLRAKRGTHKKAVLNPACKKQTGQVVRANGHARIIKRAIDPYRSGFEDRRLWSRLLSHILKHDDVQTSFDFSKFKPFDLSPTYHMDRLFDLTTHTRVDMGRSVLHVKLSSNTHPWFRSERIDGYQFEVIAIFPDQKRKSAHTEAVNSEIIELTGKAAPVELDIPVPAKSKTFLICVRVNGCANGKIEGAWSTTAMKITEAGRVAGLPDETMN